MTALPRRFPRQSLHNQLSDLESRVQRLMDETEAKRKEAQEAGHRIPAQKFEERNVGLDEIRDLVNQARRTAYFLR